MNIVYMSTVSNKPMMQLFSVTELIKHIRRC